MRAHRNCQKCGSRNVRRIASQDYLFRALYVCRSCGASSWLTRRTSYYVAASVGVVVVVLAIFSWTITSLVTDSGQEPARATRALEETARRAHAKDPAAEYDLAHKYSKGTGVRLDAREAAMWLERAAEHGHTGAQFELGMASLNGEGVLQDFSAALKWLSRAAEGGNAEARYNLGLMYKNGTVVARDDFKAYIWLNLAAAHGIEAAAAPRDSVMRLLSPRQVEDAQTEARRLDRNSVGHAGKSDIGITRPN